jgi:hypothetical protein
LFFVPWSGSQCNDIVFLCDFRDLAVLSRGEALSLCPIAP